MNSNITETIKGLLSEGEWTDLKTVISAEDRQLIDELQKQRNAAVNGDRKLRNSLGKLYGHFTSVMKCYDITPITSSGKEISPLEEKPQGQPEIVQRLQEAIKSSRKVTPKVKQTHVVAPATEIRWRRQIMENQLQQQASNVDDILTRLEKDGFPVKTDYYACKLDGHSTRLRACLHADLHLLYHRGAVSKKEGKYTWVTGVPDRYRKLTVSAVKGNGDAH